MSLRTSVSLAFISMSASASPKVAVFYCYTCSACGYWAAFGRLIWAKATLMLFSDSLITNLLLIGFIPDVFWAWLLYELTCP